MASIAKSQNLSKGEMNNENDDENFAVFSVSAIGLCSSLGRQPPWQLECKPVQYSGTTIINMSPSATTFCYLSRVSIEDTDTDGEMATCRVMRGRLVVWTLEAILGARQRCRCPVLCLLLQQVTERRYSPSDG